MYQGKSFKGLLIKKMGYSGKQNYKLMSFFFFLIGGGNWTVSGSLTQCLSKRGYEVRTMGNIFIESSFQHRPVEQKGCLRPHRVEGVLFNKDARHVIDQIVQWPWGLLALQAVLESKRAKLCPASSFSAQVVKIQY